MFVVTIVHQKKGGLPKKLEGLRPLKLPPCMGLTIVIHMLCNVLKLFWLETKILKEHCNVYDVKHLLNAVITLIHTNLSADVMSICINDKTAHVIGRSRPMLLKVIDMAVMHKYDGTKSSPITAVLETESLEY